MRKLSLTLALAVAAVLLSAGCAAPKRTPKELNKQDARAHKAEAKRKVAERKKANASNQKGPVPFINKEPQNLFVRFGTNAQFNISAGPAPLVTYQWYFNDVIIPGATSNIYQIPMVDTNKIGYYQCMVSRGFQTKASKKVTLTAYSIIGSIMTLTSLPPVSSPVAPYPTGCPNPAVGKLRFPYDDNEYVGFIPYLPWYDYYIWDLERGDTKVMYRGLEDHADDWDCGEFGFLWAFPGASDNYYFLVYFPSSPPTNPYDPYYIEVSGFHR